LKQIPLLDREARFKVGFERCGGVSNESEGMVKNSSFWIILLLMPLLNYGYNEKKASLDHLPKSITVKTGTLAKTIAMAAPLLAE
jgi:hypothetical protein